jgi:hypothetical protein
VILEARLDGRKFCIKSPGTSCGAVIPGYSTPGRQGVKVLAGVNRPVPQRSESASIYLVYHVDEILSIVPREHLDHLNLITVRKYFRDQRDALGRGEGVANQPLPSWIFTVHGKAIELTNA